MMNYQPQHIQKREIVDLEKITCKHKSKIKHWAIQFIRKMPQYKDSCYSWTELNTINSKICPWSRDLLDVNIKYLVSFFLGLSATIPSAQKVEFGNFGNSETFESGAWTKCNSTRSRWGLPVNGCLPRQNKQLFLIARIWILWTFGRRILTTHYCSTRGFNYFWSHVLFCQCGPKPIEEPASGVRFQFTREITLKDKYLSQYFPEHVHSNEFRTTF